MKKTLLSFAGILAGLFVVLSLLDARGDYGVEQILWKANKKLSDAARSPEAIPDKVFVQIADQYRKIIKDFPNSRLTSAAYLSLGKVYLIKKDYKAARERLTDVLKKYPNNSNVCAEALSAIGNSYGLEGDWPNALRTYEKLKNDYPLTDLGLSVPLYVANYYLKNSHTVNAQNALEDAIVYYDKLSLEHPNSEIELKSLKLLSDCYLMQNRWTDAVNVLGKILLKYPKPEVAVPIMKAINTIVLTQIRDFDIPINIYQGFLEKNPNHPLDKALKEMIGKFTELKKKNVKADPKKT